MSAVRKPRSLDQNAKFHACLGEWAQRSGQDATSLKLLVKDHLGQFTDLELPNDPLTDRLLTMFARVLLALGKPELMRVLPDRRVARLYHTSAKFTKEQMASAIETVHLLAAKQGHTLDINTWDRSAG